MATIKYNGMELQSITECKVFEEPREMLVWNENYERPIEKLVCAIIPYRREGSVITRGGAFEYCAEITEKPAPRRVTWEQLAYWLVDGRGLVLDADTNRVDTGVFFSRENMQEEVGERWQVMARGDSEWHEPTLDYMGIGEGK